MLFILTVLSEFVKCSPNTTAKGTVMVATAIVKPTTAVLAIVSILWPPGSSVIKDLALWSTGMSVAELV